MFKHYFLFLRNVQVKGAETKQKCKSVRKPSLRESRVGLSVPLSPAVRQKEGHVPSGTKKQSQTLPPDTLSVPWPLTSVFDTNSHIPRDAEQGFAVTRYRCIRTTGKAAQAETLGLGLRICIPNE